MKLYLEDDPNGQAIHYLPDSDPAPDLYTITVEPEDWNKYLDAIMNYDDATFVDVRNEMINQFEPNWATYIDDQQRSLIQNYIWPSETPDSELDDLYDDVQRDYYQDEVMVKLNVGVIHIIESPAKNNFIVTATDGGVIGLVPITTDTII